MMRIRVGGNYDMVEVVLSTEVQAAPHGTIHAVVDRNAGVLEIHSELDQHPADYAWSLELISLAAGSGPVRCARFVEEAEADVFAYEVAPEVLARVA
jgi:hypothetical protein